MLSQLYNRYPGKFIQFFLTKSFIKIIKMALNTLFKLLLLAEAFRNEFDINTVDILMLNHAHITILILNGRI